MSDERNKLGRRSPPSASRFQPGTSGNPRGRPRKEPQQSASAFDVVIDRTLTITQGGQPREVTIDEALQHKTYQDAIGGNRAARRQILTMIEKREKARAARNPARTPVEVRKGGPDPRNADEAMLILGIAAIDPDRHEPDEQRLKLEAWAVQAAIDRARGKPLSSRERTDIRACIRNQEVIRWPNGAED